MVYAKSGIHESYEKSHIKSYSILFFAVCPDLFLYPPLERMGLPLSKADFWILCFKWIQLSSPWVSCAMDAGGVCVLSWTKIQALSGSTLSIHTLCHVNIGRSLLKNLINCTHALIPFNTVNGREPSHGSTIQWTCLSIPSCFTCRPSFWVCISDL